MEHLPNLDAYLQQSYYLDYDDPHIQELVQKLNRIAASETERIRVAYEFVRDEISHSYDIRSEEVTRKASDVLLKKHGICYAKSHLLAAILRGMGVPSGICYQRLTLYDKPEDGYCIHALNTVYINDLTKWIRLDARGNKAGIDAQFSIEEEKLAFPIRHEYDEKDYNRNYAEPHPAIIRTLEGNDNCMQMYQRGLPKQLTEES